MNTNLIQISSARMKFKRTFKTIFFFCMLSFLYPGKLYASHAMGSDITYYYLGANQYQIRFSFYRDCTGIPVSVSTGDITITNLNSLLNFDLIGTTRPQRNGPDLGAYERP